MVFGKARAEAAVQASVPQAVPAPSSLPVAAKNQTMVFGKLPDRSVPISNRTMVFGASGGDGDLASRPTAPGGPEGRSDERVPRHAVAPQPRPPPHAAGSLNRTQLFASPISDARGADHARVIAPETTLEVNKQESAQGPTLGPALSSPRQTMVFGGPARVSAPGAAAADASTIPALGDDSISAPPTDPSAKPLRAELPPEPVFPLAALRTEPETAIDDEAEIAVVRAAAQRRTTVAVVAFLAMALVVGLVLLWQLFGRSILSKDLPPEIRADLESAIALLRLDDRASQEKAIASLRGLLSRAPQMAEVRSGLVLALALRYDDLGEELRQGEARLKAIQDSSEPSAKEGAAQSEVAAIRQARKSAGEALKAEETRLEAQRATLEQASNAELDALRSLAVARAVQGDAQALGLAEAYRQRRKGADNWVDLAMPEYMVNGGSQPRLALAALDEVKKRPNNSTFLRAYVLDARLSLRLGDTMRAEAELGKVTALNSRHELATLLLADIKAASGSESPEAPDESQP